MVLKALARKNLARIALSVVGVMGVTAIVATPAYADTTSGDTTANVSVSGAITITALTPSFTLTGIPGAVDQELSAVTMTVTTNNFAGYSVTVAPLAATLASTLSGNTDSIPTSDLTVRTSGSGAYTALAFGTPFEVANKASASAADGDPVSNDYRMTIPFVQPDTYTGTIEYVATTL